MSQYEVIPANGDKFLPMCFRSTYLTGEHHLPDTFQTQRARDATINYIWDNDARIHYAGFALTYSTEYF